MCPYMKSNLLVILKMSSFFYMYKTNILWLKDHYIQVTRYVLRKCDKISGNKLEIYLIIK